MIRKDFDNGSGKLKKELFAPHHFFPNCSFVGVNNRACDRLGDTGCPLINVHVQMLCSAAHGVAWNEEG